MNVTGLHWWAVSIGSGNGLVPSGNKPLPEPMLTQICHHMASLGHNELTHYGLKTYNGVKFLVINEFFIKKMDLKMSPAKCDIFCSGLIVLSMANKSGIILGMGSDNVKWCWAHRHYDPCKWTFLFLEEWFHPYVPQNDSGLKGLTTINRDMCSLPPFSCPL